MKKTTNIQSKIELLYKLTPRPSIIQYSQYRRIINNEPHMSHT